MTKEEKLKMLLETGEFEFLKDIPSDTIWKLVFALGFVQGETVTEFADRCRECGKRQTGHWIDTKTQDSMTGKVFKCSKCRGFFIKDFNFNYCPACGIKMIKEDSDGRMAEDNIGRHEKS